MKNSIIQNADSSLPLVIVNPKSAAGATQGRWADTAADFRAHFGPFQVAFTKKAGDGRELALRGAAQGRRFIIACGGDGTINEVANGILESGSDIEFGILPSGTGGDFRRSLGLPTETRAAGAALAKGVTKSIDVGRVSFVGHDGQPVSRYFLNVASFGLSAAIIERVKTTTKLEWLPHDVIRGKTSFALSTLQEILGLAAETVRVRFDDGDETHLNTVNFCVCNARYFGGGMMIAPNAVVTDGQFDVVNIGDIGTAKIVLNGYRLYGGSHLNLKEVGAKHARKVEVSPSDGREIQIEVDGELPGRLPATFEIIPKALKVRVPKQG